MRGIRIKTLNNEVELGSAYTEWLESKSLGGDNECIRFGQYIYNTYDLEYKNSYNEGSELLAYNLLSGYLYHKELENESK